jgi:alpha-galactosidase
VPILTPHSEQKAGYQYVNIDDCWSVKSGRDSKTNQIKPDLAKFPQGISGLANKIHGLGLKLGIYSSAGTETCADYPASLGYEAVDAATFASWGIDCEIPFSRIQIGEGLGQESMTN